jgi:hypothetical protein
MIDSLNMLAVAKWFSAVNLNSGCWQVTQQPDKGRTAFSTDQEL